MDVTLKTKWFSKLKCFSFETWCDMMQVPLETRMMLTDYIIKDSKEIQEFFQIHIERQKVISFSAKTGLFICEKTNILKR